MKKLTLTVMALISLYAKSFSQSYPADQTSEYAATVMTSSFTVPILRFNPIDNVPNKKGNVALFNSIGAGISFNAGRLFITADHNGKALVEEFKNTIGIQLGALFSVNTSENETNVFAPTVGIALLDFHVGIGHDFGTVDENQSRTFITIAYAVPLSKFTKKGFHLFKRSDSPVTENKKSIQKLD